MLRFYSIDLETTGLDYRKHSVTEFAAVFTDLELSFTPKTFYRWLDPEDYLWSNYCLRLHSKWIDRVTARIEAKAWEATDTEPKICRSMNALIHDFKTWMFTECGHPVPDDNGKWEKITPAGKNFGSFDKNFLEKANWPAMFRHRAIDPTGLYLDKAIDSIPPELAQCKKRAIADGYTVFKSDIVAHNALDDAKDVASLFWHKYAHQLLKPSDMPCPTCFGQGCSEGCPTCRQVAKTS